MDYKEKYEKALERAAEILGCGPFNKGSIEKIFPELVESEDERIKKEIIDYIKTGTYKKDWLAWLEKQDEQKPTDKIEPKFNIGDWIVYNRIDSSREILYVYDIRDNRYYFNDMCHFSWSVKECDEKCHLWTITDIKDGDVLAFYSEYRGNKMVQVGIIEKYVGKHGGCSNTFKIYVGVNWDNNFQIGEYMGCSDIRPATKEQRDILMKAIADAGYTFDFKKKELKESEQKSLQWNISDYKTWQYIVSDVLTLHDGIGQYLDDGFCKNIAKNMQEEWSKKLSLGQNPAWSEEDERILKDIILDLQVFRDKDYGEAGKAAYQKEIDWLKSLRSQNTWKPSDEQMDAIRLARSFVVDDFDEHPTLSEILMELEEQLKRLKG